MTERSWLVESHFDRCRAANDTPYLTPAPSARRRANAGRAAAVSEPPFFVARYSESVDPFAVISADRLVVAPMGYVDMDTAPLLGSALMNAVDSHPEVCCDLAAVTFFSAAGVYVLLVAHDRAGRSGSRFAIRGASGITLHVLRITQVERLLNSSTRPPRRDRRAGH